MPKKSADTAPQERAVDVEESLKDRLQAVSEVDLSDDASNTNASPEAMASVDPEIQAWMDKYAEAKAESEALREQMLRKLAEVENFRKRTEQEKVTAKQYAIDAFANELLQVVDSLEQALDSVQSTPQDPVMYEGVQLTHKLLIDILKKFDLHVIDPQGEAFDPNAHEALSMQISEEIPHNHVLMVVQKGYRLAKRVIRPAKVIVAQPEKK